MTKKFLKILHSADFHLESPFKFLDASRRKEAQKAQLQAFYDMLNLAREQAVDFLTIAGDLFDFVKPNQVLLQSVLEGLQSIPKVCVIIVPGNHDYWHINSFWQAFSCLDNVYLFDPDTFYFTFPKYQITFWGKAFTGQSALRNLWQDEAEQLYAEKRNQMNILVQHADLSCQESHYNPISPAWIDKLGFDLALLGHIHNRTEPFYTKRNIPCLYNGCVQARGFDEIGERGVHLIEIPLLDISEISISFIPLKQIYFQDIKIDVSNFEPEDNLQWYEKLKQLFLDARPKNKAARNCYRLILTGRISRKINVELLYQKLEKTCFYLEIKDQTKMKFDYQNLRKEHSLRGDVSRYVEKLTAQPELLNDVLKQLNLENLSRKVSADMIEQAYYYTMQAEEQDIDIYED